MFCDVFRKSYVAIDELKENLPLSVVQILIRLKDYSNVEKVGLEDEQCAVQRLPERLTNMNYRVYGRTKDKKSKRNNSNIYAIVRELQDMTKLIVS